MVLWTVHSFVMFVQNGGVIGTAEAYVVISTSNNWALAGSAISFKAN